MNEIIVIEKQNLKELISNVIEEKFILFSRWFEGKLIENERPLTPSEAMEYLSMSKSTFYRNVNNGTIHKYGLGKSVFFKQSQLDEAIKRVN